MISHLRIFITTSMKKMFADQILIEIEYFLDSKY